MDPSTATGISAFTLVLSQLGKQAGDVMVIVRAFAYAAAIFFLYRGIVMMTNAATPQARQAAESKTAWVWSLAAAWILFALPETMSVIGWTLFPYSDTGSLSYDNLLMGQGMTPGSCQLGGIKPLLILFGYIAFVRGILVFREVGRVGNHARPGVTVSRATILLTAGLGLVHMMDVLKGIQTLTGLQVGAGLC